MGNPKVVILCGGMGTRLKEETEFKPKPLVSVGGKPILWHIMKIYSSYGFNDFILCLGYKGDMIKQYFLNYESQSYDFTLNLKSKMLKTYDKDKVPDWKITFVDTGLHSNTGARIKKIEKYIDGERFFLTYGDGVANVNIGRLLEFHKDHGRIGTVTTVRPSTRFGNLTIDEKNRITDFTKKTLMHEGWIDGGFFVFESAIFDYLSEDEDCMLEDKPLKQLAADCQFVSFKHKGYWQCMDTYRDYLHLNDIWDSGAAAWKLWKD